MFKDNSDNLAALASALLAKDLKLASLVNRKFSSEFDGKRGASVNVRVPASLTANSRNLGTLTTFINSNLVEATQAVALTKDYYSRTVIDDEDLTLSVEGYASQVLLPQTMAIATTIENAVHAQAQAVAETAGLDTTYNPGTATEIIPFLVDARKALRDMGAPETGLVAALSTSAYAALLKAVAGASYDQGLGSVASARIVQAAGLSIVE